jgi:hypothetical protein
MRAVGAIETARDALFGNPPNPAQEPSREGILAAFTELSQSIANLSLGSLPSAAFETLADANLDLDYDAGTIALIYGDTVNDFAVKSGVSGSGSWALTTILRDAQESISQPYVDEAKAWANQNEDVVVEGGEYSAKHYAAKADQAKSDILDDPGFVAVSGDLTGDDKIGAVADSIADVGTVADNIGDVGLVADNIGDISALVAPVPPVPIISTRSLTAADHNKRLLTEMPDLVEDGVEDVRIPSNSVAPQDLGTTFKLYWKSGAPVRVVPDDAGEAQFLGATSHIALSTAMHWVEMFQEEENVWRVTGVWDDAAYEPLDPGTHKLLVDPSDFDTMYANAAGTVPFGGSVGDPVCAIDNKGTLGGRFAAPSDSRGYTLQIIDGAYALVRAASDSCLILPTATGNLNLAQIDLFLGIKTGTHVQNNGILLFQSATVGDTNKNDGGFVYMGANQGDLAWRMGTPAMLPEAPGSMRKYPHVLELYKPGNGATGYLSVDNQFDASVVNPSPTVTSLTTMGGALIFGARSANSPPLNLGNFGDVALFGMVGGDAILTTGQRNAARAWMESKTYGTVPRYPALNTLADVTAARNVLINEVFSGSGIPSTLGTMATDGSPPITGLTNLASVEKMTPGSYALRPRVFTPNSARTDVVVLIWNGHSTAMGTYAINTLTQQLLTANVTVVNMVLPSGSNDYTSGSPPQHYAAAPSYAEWVGPFCIAVNTMRNRYPGAKIIVTGISGGGWASLMSAAVDARVSTNISVVGWLPEHIHQNRDYEQLLDDISGGYMNLALIAAADGRRNICRLHSLDTVGFGAAVYNQRPDAFAGLSTRATALGGYFAVSIEAVAPHSYSTNDRALVLAELP